MADLVKYPRWSGDQPDDRHLQPIDDDFWERFNLYRSALFSRGGPRVTIVSGYRFYDEQLRLYNGWLNHLPGFNLAARPGTSNHEKGLAIDQDPNFDQQTLDVAAEYSLEFPLPTEHWHIQPRSARGLSMAPLPTIELPPPPEEDMPIPNDYLIRHRDNRVVLVNGVTNLGSIVPSPDAGNWIKADYAAQGKTLDDLTADVDRGTALIDFRKVNIVATQ